jgi:hypothetical protein
MGQPITETIKNITDAPANKGLLGLIKHEGRHKEKGKLLPALVIPLKKTTKGLFMVSRYRQVP